MFLSVIGIVSHPVNARSGNGITGLEDISNVSHLYSLVAGEAHPERNNGRRGMGVKQIA